MDIIILQAVLATMQVLLKYKQALINTMEPRAKDKRYNVGSWAPNKLSAQGTEYIEGQRP